MCQKLFQNFLKISTESYGSFRTNYFTKNLQMVATESKENTRHSKLQLSNACIYYKKSILVNDVPSYAVSSIQMILEVRA